MQQQTLTPVSAHERIQTIDILRGFALLGIVTLTADNGANAPWNGRTGFLDQLVFWPFYIFVDDKFQNIFCFLFGLGFCIQMQRAAARNSSFALVFIWRMIVLFLMASIFLIFTGERLVIIDYAIVGVLLLLFWKMPVRVLPVLILLFALYPWTSGIINHYSNKKIPPKNIATTAATVDKYTGVYMVSFSSLNHGRVPEKCVIVRRDSVNLIFEYPDGRFGGPLASSYQVSKTKFFDSTLNATTSFLQNARGEFNKLRVHFDILRFKGRRINIDTTEARKLQAEQLAIINGQKQLSYAEFLKTNTTSAWLVIKNWYWKRSASYYVSIVLTLFLLGLYAGRRRIFYDIEGNRTILKKTRFWGLLSGTILVVVFAGMKALQYIRGGDEEFGFLTNSLFDLSWKLGAILMALGIIATITLLVQHEKWRKRLSFLAPVGRMGLTNFILQALAGVLIMSELGLGLGNKVGGFYGLLVQLPVFVLIVVVSHWWFNHFKYGPLEWLWRSFTYLKFQPMRLKAPKQSSNQNQ